MMKRFFLLLMMVSAFFISNAQVLRPSQLPTTNAPGRFDITGYQMDSAFLSIIRATFPAKYPSLIRKTVDSAFWYTNGGWAGAPWWKIIDQKDTTSMLAPYLKISDTAYMLANYITTNGYGLLKDGKSLIVDTLKPNGLTTRERTQQQIDSVIGLISSSGGGTVLSVSATDGVGIISSVSNPTSNPNISLRVDTLTISTRLHVDSVAMRKLNISDTSLMLSNLLRTSDTAAMLSNRLKISDTATMLAPFVQYSDTAYMLSNRLKISDTAYMLSNRLKISDTTYMLSNRLKISDTTTMLARGWLSNRSADSILVLRTLINTKGTGTVASVGFIAPSFLTITNSPITTSGNITATLANQTANTVFSGPTTGSAAQPTFRALVAADLPDSYLPISDTASMLSNRLKISDTSWMLSPYLKIFDPSKNSVVNSIETIGSATINTNLAVGSSPSYTSNFDIVSRDRTTGAYGQVDSVILRNYINAAPSSGSVNYIQNNRGVSQSAGYRINGIGSALTYTPVGTINTSKLFYVQGNSLDIGVGATYSWLHWAYPNFSGLYDTLNNANGGKTVWTMMSQADTLDDVNIRPTSSINIYSLGSATNDLYDSSNVVRALSNTSATIRARKLKGWKVLAYTCIARDGVSANGTNMTTLINAYNDSLRTRWKQMGADALVDVGSFFTNPGNYTYYNVDGVHLVDSGYKVYAAMVYPIANKLINETKFGRTNFTDSLVSDLNISNHVINVDGFFGDSTSGITVRNISDAAQSNESSIKFNIKTGFGFDDLAKISAVIENSGGDDAGSLEFKTNTGDSRPATPTTKITLGSNGVANYKSNYGSLFGSRSLIDKNYADSITALKYTLPTFTTGSVIFVNSTPALAQDNSNLFWDNTNKRLGLGTASPLTRFQANVSASSDSMTLGSAGNSGFSILNSTGLFGLFAGVSTGSGNTWIQGGRNDGNTAAYDIHLQRSGGHLVVGGPGVGDGVSTLHVIGTMAASSVIKAAKLIGNTGTDNGIDAVQANGSVLAPLYRMEGKIQASSTTIDATATVWNDNTNGSTVTYTLPGTSSLAGGFFGFIKTGTGNLTLSGTIVKKDGTSAGGTLTLASTDGLQWFWFNGSTWYQSN